MNTTIKQRLAQINNGGTPYGYRKTTYGVFPCDWIEVQFGEIAFLSKRQYSRSETDDNPICIELEHLGEGYRNGNSYGQEQSSNKNSFEIGDVLFGKLRPYLKKYYLAKENGVCSTEIWVIKSRNVNNLFLYFIIGSDRFITVADESAFGTKMPRAEWKTVIKCRFPIPANQSEQARIAEILMKWDEAIELYEQLIEKYKQRKAIFLQKMFPAKGKDVPEWRFKGFTTPWEQRKVAELFKVTRGYVLATSFTSETQTDEKPYPVYSSQTKDNGLMGYYKDYLYENAITWTTDGANAGTVVFRAGKFYCTNVCGVLLANKAEPNQMIAEALNNVAKGYVSYVGNPKLMNNVMAEIEISLPVDEKERKRISALFNRIDNLITLHQRKLDTLKKQRKALQQYLLTGIVRVV